MALAGQKQMNRDFRKQCSGCSGSNSNLLYALLMYFAFSAVCSAADSCEDRVVHFVAPILPHTPRTGVVLAGGPCLIEVRYEISKSGKVTSAVPVDFDDRCAVFERSAIATIVRSKFKAGKTALICSRTVEFSAEPSDTSGDEVSSRMQAGTSAEHAL